ncbi:MAG TPA: hypothetical protein VNT26_23475, partial [Candidatus Sulfotelmatobacter sp.]|nr:hypothetical protein [Candidatus Sulfotelmatobacter sp.]
MISHGHKLIALVGLLASLLNLTTTTNAAVLPSSVTLAWDPSPGAGVMGYRIYQGVVSQTYTNVIDAGNVTS